MLHIVYQYSWAFNLETLLMLGILANDHLVEKCFQMYTNINRQIDLIDNCQNFILKLKKSQLKYNCKMSCSWKLLVKKGFSTSELKISCFDKVVTEIQWIALYI